jgi:hypothetical protein
MVDTCSFTALHRTYPREVPTFEPIWRTVETLAAQGRLFSIDLVLDELNAVDDEISQWANAHPELFLPLDTEIQERAREILATYQRLVDYKKKKSSADPFLIAAAIVKQAVVVTEERPSGGPPALKIPDVCKPLRVDCIPLLEMIRRQSGRG